MQSGSEKKNLTWRIKDQLWQINPNTLCEKFSFTCSFSRKQWLKIFAKAGLLTCSTFWGLPISINRNSGNRSFKKLFLELTATGIVPDFHRIPFSFSQSNEECKKPNASQMYTFFNYTIKNRNLFSQLHINNLNLRREFYFLFKKWSLLKK